MNPKRREKKWDRAYNRAAHKEMPLFPPTARTRSEWLRWRRKMERAEHNWRRAGASRGD